MLGYPLGWLSMLWSRGSQVQQVVPDELLLQLLVSWLAPARMPAQRDGSAAATAVQCAGQLATHAGSASGELRMPAVSATQLEMTAAMAGRQLEQLPATVRPGFLLPPADADIGCLPSSTEASGSLRGGIGGLAGLHDDDGAARPLSGAEQPAPAQPLSICCRRALSLPLSRDGHECGGGSPSSGRAPLQVRCSSLISCNFGPVSSVALLRSLVLFRIDAGSGLQEVLHIHDAIRASLASFAAEARGLELALGPGAAAGGYQLGSLLERHRFLRAVCSCHSASESEVLFPAARVLAEGTATSMKV